MLPHIVCCLGLYLTSPVALRPDTVRTSTVRTGGASTVSMVFPGEGIYTGDGIPEGPSRLTVGDDYVDPLEKPRPKYDLCAASGKPDEVCVGAIAPESAAALGEWITHMTGGGENKPNCPSIKLQPLARTLALMSDEEAATRSPDGTPAGYDEALRAAGFTDVKRVDLQAPGSRAVVLDALRAAKAARERTCVHCADGTTLTSVVMCDWLLTDYIGGDNTEEAAHALAIRRRLGGVERLADPEIIAKFIVNGCMGDAPPGAGGDGGGEPPPTKVSPGGILLI